MRDRNKELYEKIAKEIGSNKCELKDYPGNAVVLRYAQYRFRIRGTQECSLNFTAIDEKINYEYYIGAINLGKSENVHYYLLKHIKNDNSDEYCLMDNENGVKIHFPTNRGMDKLHQLSFEELIIKIKEIISK